MMDWLRWPAGVTQVTQTQVFTDGSVRRLQRNITTGETRVRVTCLPARLPSFDTWVDVPEDADEMSQEELVRWIQDNAAVAYEWSF